MYLLFFLFEYVFLELFTSISDPRGNIINESVCRPSLAHIFIPDESVWGIANEINIEKTTKVLPQTILVRYGERLFIFEQAKPPKNDATKIEVYPIGSIRANGSGKEIAIAVPNNKSARLIPIVIDNPIIVELMSLSIEL